MHGMVVRAPCYYPEDMQGSLERVGRAARWGILVYIVVHGAALPRTAPHATAAKRGRNNVLTEAFRSNTRGPMRDYSARETGMIN